MNIKEWAQQDRPREKMQSEGPAALSDAELLAILLRVGRQGRTAVDLARDVLKACNNSLLELGRVLLSGAEAKKAFKGLGAAKICAIQAALELGRRRAREEELKRVGDAEIVNCSQAVFAQFGHYLSDLDHEELWALYLSGGGKILHRACISRGGVNFSAADVRTIMRPALEYMATHIAICHNHPHGSLNPSSQDREVTRKLREAFKLFDMRLLDHLIVSDGQYYSMADNGDL